MAYMLQVKLGYNGKTEDYEYKTLDISKSSMFEGISTYNRAIDKKKSEYRGKSSKYDLKDIDKFTINFKDEDELRKHLIDFGILDRKYSSCKLVIRFDAKKKAVKEYDILYSGAELYFEPQAIYQELYNRLLCQDFNFIGRVADRLRNSYECGNTACEIYNLANSRDVYSRNNGFNRRDYFGNDIITDFVYSMCYKYKISNGTKVFSNEIIWRTLHQLVAVISEVLSLEKKLSEKQDKGIGTHHAKKLELKTKTETAEECSQMSIMDWFWSRQGN